jgi:hypothetical protein
MLFGEHKVDERRKWRGDRGSGALALEGIVASNPLGFSTLDLLLSGDLLPSSDGNALGYRLSQGVGGQMGHFGTFGTFSAVSCTPL